jgi:hypothetical protein
VYSSSDTLNVIEKLPDWFEEVGDVILMDPPGSSPATRAADSSIFMIPHANANRRLSFSWCVFQSDVVSPAY